MNWLSDLWNGVKTLLRPLLNIKHWKVWAELWALYLRVRKWLDWYRNNVHAHLQQLQALRRQIYATFVLPILTIIDTIRRASQVVALISPKLAAKLNSIFLRIEDRLLKPFQTFTTRLNVLGNVLRSTLTPLGYFDRATLLNSAWRDVRQLREILRNPLRGIIPPAPAPAQITSAQKVANIDQYFSEGTGPVAESLQAKRDAIDATMQTIR